MGGLWIYAFTAFDFLIFAALEREKLKSVGEADTETINFKIPLSYIVAQIPEKVQRWGAIFLGFSLCNINKLAKQKLAHLSKI